MGSYEIMVVQTDELSDYCLNQHGDSNRARKRAETFIQGAVEASTSHSVSFITPSNDMSSPQQSIGNSFSAYSPCSASKYTYDNLLQYFDDWLDCIEYNRAADVNVILTDTNSSDGGLAYSSGTYDGLCGAKTGQGIADAASSYVRYGYSFEHDCVHTLLEEVGHVLLSGNTTDGDGDGIYDHDSGRIDLRDLGNTITPMSINNEEGDNACGKTNNCGWSWNCSSVNGWSLYWSNCAANEFRNPY